MPIELTWLVPDKILLSRWYGDIDEQPIGVMIEEMSIILNDAQGPVHTLMDWSEVDHLAPSTIYAYLQSPIPMHPNWGRVGGYSPTVKGKILSDLIHCLTQDNMIRLFHSREEACHYLLGHEAQPPVLPVGPDRRRSCPGPLAPDAQPRAG